MNRANPRSLSVVICAWNEAPLIADAVRNAGRIADEVIVVDGGSNDGTAGLAREAGAKVIVTKKGRGIQLHAGALQSRSDALLFLHADVRLAQAARAAIFDALRDPCVIGGNFRIDFLPAYWFTRGLAAANDVRRRLTARYYGDSGIFVRSGAYHALCGFKPFPLMEDYDFSSRLEREARGAYLRNVAMYASARRFRGRELRTVSLWIAIQLLYWFKVPPRLLALAYADIRGDDAEFLAACHRRLS